MRVTIGALHQSAHVLVLQDILRASLDFSFVRGVRVCHISGSSLVQETLESRKFSADRIYQRSDGVFFFIGADGAIFFACCTM